MTALRQARKTGEYLYLALPVLTRPYKGGNWSLMGFKHTCLVYTLLPGARSPNEAIPFLVEIAKRSLCADFWECGVDCIHA